MNLTALPEERLLEGPPPKRPAAVRRYALIVLLCFLAHALAIVLLVRYGGLGGGPAPAAEEIPVEIVMEPPPPKQPDPPAPKQEQPKDQMIFDEKEATDAPKASDQKAERDVRVEAPKSLDAKPAAQHAEPAQSSERSVAASAAEDSAQQQKDDRPDGEPLKAADKPRPEPETAKAEEVAPKPEKQQSEDQLAAALRYAPDGWGNAEARYFTAVFGRVAPHLNCEKVAAGRRHHQGEVVFGIDYGGALGGVKMIKSSGLPDLDASAISALRAAAPFPLPPTGGNIGISFKFCGD